MNSKKTMNVLALAVLFITGTSVSHAMEREDGVHVPLILKTHPESGDEESLELLEEKARRIKKIAEFKEEVQKIEENLLKILSVRDENLKEVAEFKEVVQKIKEEQQFCEASLLQSYAVRAERIKSIVNHKEALQKIEKTFQQDLAEHAEAQQKDAERRRILVEKIGGLASKVVVIKSTAAQLKAEREEQINAMIDTQAQLPISMQTQIDNETTDRFREHFRAQGEELESQEGQLAKQQTEIRIMAESLQLEEEDVQREIELFIKKKNISQHK